MKNSIYKQFWKYTIPTVAAMLVNGLYQVVDGIFIGRFVGADGLAAINIAWPLIGAVLGLGMLIGVGTGALVSIRQGEEKLTKAKSTLATGLMLLALVSPLISGFLFAFSESLMHWQGAKSGILELALQYMDILMFSALFSLGSIALPFLVRNDNSPKFATWLMVIGAVINIALDYLFIAVWGWELRGAALATAFAQGIITLLGVGYFFSSRATMRLTRRCLVLDWSVVPNIASIGISSFFMYFYGSAMVAVHNLLFTQYGDLLMVGAYAILGYIVTIYYLAGEGIANGMQPLVSYNFGARNQPNIDKLLKVAIGSVVILGIAFVVVLNLYAREFALIFNAENETLIAYTIQGVRLHMFALFLDGFLVVAGAYYQAINQGRKAMFVMIGNMLIQLPFLYILPKLFGVTGIWIAYPLSNIALSVVVIAMLLRDSRKRPMIDASVGA